MLLKTQFSKIDYMYDHFSATTTLEKFRRDIVIKQKFETCNFI